VYLLWLNRRFEKEIHDVGLPVTLFIGADGLLMHTHVGEISREVLLREIAGLQ